MPPLAFAHIPWQIELSRATDVRRASLSAQDDFRNEHGDGFRFRAVFANPVELDEALMDAYFVAACEPNPTTRQTLAAWMEVSAVTIKGYEIVSPLDIAASQQLLGIVQELSERHSEPRRWKYCVRTETERRNLERAANEAGVEIVVE